MSRVTNGHPHSTRPSRRMRLAIAFGMAGFLCGLVPPASAEPGQSNTAQGMAAATVVEALQARQEQDLSFGAIIAGEQAGGEVVVDPAGGPARYSGAVQAACTGGAASCQPRPARFAAFGAPGRAYTVTLPAGVAATGQRTGARLSVGALLVRSRNRPDAAGGVLDIHGEDSFTVGGTLTVPAATPADIFRADLPILVQYD